MVVDVIVGITSNKLDQTFSYLVPENLKNKISKGYRVRVPFSNRFLEGFVLNVKPYIKEENNYQLKEIINLVDDYPVLNDEMLALGEYISEKTYSSKILTYQAMLPKALKSNQKVSIKYDTYITFNEMQKDEKLTKKQLELIDIIKKEKKVLKKQLSLSIVKTLLSKNILKEVKKESYRLTHKNFIKNKVIKLTQEQFLAKTEILNSKNFNPFLLHGITGSGKTEVYMEVIEEVINNNKEVIVLVPEISLTPILINNFKNRFGNNIAVLHSHLSPGERYDEWRKIQKKEVKIVVGARSAVFAPFTNIGLIIIDEEHSETYKQENNPKYHAIDIAIRRCQNYNCPLILGSATPSVESYTRAKLGIYKLLQLTKRINNSYPEVQLVDMNIEIKKKNMILSDLLKQKIQKNLDNKEQTIILLNRRGYSTTMTCQNCGYNFKCPKCEIPLTYHKVNNNIKCHYCDYIKIKPNHCLKCGNKDIIDYGLGTQKLEEYIKKIYPLSNVVRMDVDTTIKKGSHEKIIEEFYNQKYDILIGTQMIAKGLDFPNVTLVGVINADKTLNIPDFRSSEKTFQLLNQVSGRAGRDQKTGEVVIQTFNVDHYSINYAINNDYSNFYNYEINLRKKLNYPPFTNLCLIKLSGTDFNFVNEEANKIYEYLIKNKFLTVLGPNSSYIPKINNVYYVQVLIKYKKNNQISCNLNFIKNHYKNNNKLKVDIDINPLKI